MSDVAWQRGVMRATLGVPIPFALRLFLRRFPPLFLLDLFPQLLLQCLPGSLLLHHLRLLLGAQRRELEAGVADLSLASTTSTTSTTSTRVARCTLPLV